MTAASSCQGCGTELAPALLACPGCGRLVHAATLEALATEARRHEEAERRPAAMASWRRALELLPPGSRQREQIERKLGVLGTGAPPALPPPGRGSRSARWLASLGVVGLLLWKFKFVVVLVLTKAKLLVLGLTKAPTLLSMLASFGVYWAAWGWRFALGLLATMYVHEMGHVFALTRYGIRASVPMFVPGVGAFVRMDQYPVNPREDARVGLAGPLWGLIAALAAWGVSLAGGGAAWAATARASAWLNLFNLLPLGVLDGGRGFRSLTRVQRYAATAGLALAWAWSHEGLLALLFLVAAGRATMGKAPEEPDGVGLAQYVALVAALTALSGVPVDFAG